MEDLGILRQIPYFSNLEDRDLQLLAEVGQKKDYPQGGTVLEENEVNNFLYFIVSGQVRVYPEKISGREVTLSVLKKGDAFGEACLYSDERASPKVVAVQETTVVRFNKDDFLRSINNNPIIIANILREGGINRSHDNGYIHDIENDTDEDSKFQREFSIFEKRFSFELEGIKSLYKEIEELSNNTSAYIKDKSQETISWVEQRSKEAIEYSEKRSKEVTEHAEKQVAQVIESAESSVAKALEESKARNAAAIIEVEDAISSSRTETEAIIKKYEKRIKWIICTGVPILIGILGYLNWNIYNIRQTYEVVKGQEEYITKVGKEVEKFRNKLFDLSSLEAIVLNIGNAMQETNLKIDEIDRCKTANITYDDNRKYLIRNYIASTNYEEYKPEVVVDALNNFLKIVNYSDGKIENDEKYFIINSFRWSLRKIKEKEDFRYRLKNRDNLILFGEILKKRTSDFYSNQLMPVLNSILTDKEYNDEAKFAVAETLARLGERRKDVINILMSVMNNDKASLWKRYSSAVSLIYLQEPKGREYLLSEMEPHKENYLKAAMSLGEAMVKSDTINIGVADRQTIIKRIEEGINKTRNKFQRDYANAILTRLKEKEKGKE